MVAVVSADFAAVTAAELSRACDACPVLQKLDLLSASAKPGFIAKGCSKFTQPFEVVSQKGPATYLLSDGKVWNAIHLAPTPPTNSSVPTSQPDDACLLPSTSESPETVQSPPPLSKSPKDATCPSMVQRL
ncbi:solute carrier organic anion transporter family member 3A1 isoform X1 [Tachysurus ichikawai]